MRSFSAPIATLALVAVAGAGLAAASLYNAAHTRSQAPVARTNPAPAHPFFDLRTHRMDVDVDGAPNAYGPPGTRPLDYLIHAHTMGNPEAEVVGYLTDDDDPTIPIRQGASDPYPGYYISQTAFTDPNRTDPRDVRRYVDATRINYVVLGTAARHRGARVGDFVAVHSASTGRTVFALVGDAGNPSGDEGSLHLLQDLGYPFRDGMHDSVERSEITIRFFPHSNPQRFFPQSQADLTTAARSLGLDDRFSTDSAANTPPRHRIE